MNDEDRKREAKRATLVMVLFLVIAIVGSLIALWARNLRAAETTVQIPVYCKDGMCVIRATDLALVAGTLKHCGEGKTTQMRYEQ